jgi:hypothetical protein
VLSTLNVNNLCTLGTIIRGANSAALPAGGWGGKTPTFALTFIRRYAVCNWHIRSGMGPADA